MSVIKPYNLLSKGSLEWPPHWRGVVFKVKRERNVLTYQDVFIVTPRNPAYDEYLELSHSPAASQGHFTPAPSLTLDPISFDTLEEVDNWARICARLDK